MNLRAAAQRLSALVSGRVATEHPLAGLTTYRLGGNAALYVEPESAEDLVAVATVLKEEGPPVLVLGRGSNVVISDDGFPGVVIRPGPSFSWVRARSENDDDAPGLRAGAATPLPQVANWASRRGLAGVEFTIAIPGSVGGAVKMNAGAHGAEMSDRLDRVLLLDLATAEVDEVGRDDLDLSYRHSRLGDTDVVLEASFLLDQEAPDDVRSRMEGYRKHRAETQPGAAQNAGSVFKNPPGDSAGRLVEAAGLKGFAVGGAAVSDLHANFFIAGDGATAQDVYDLVGEVRRRVKDASGVDLDPEIHFIGRFREKSDRLGDRARKEKGP
jgi:UDP-N-acetylmuramate dehydrogenase